MYAGRGGWRGGRGGGARPMFQAKKWVKPGSSPAPEGGDQSGAGLPNEATLVPIEKASEAATQDPSQGADERRSPVLWEGQTQAPNRKWVKGQAPGGANPPQEDPNRAESRSPVLGAPAGAPPPTGDSGRGRVSISVTNLDPGVTEDNLWKFFGQAGRIATVKIMPRKPNKPFVLAFVNFADGTLKKKCLEMCMVLNGTAPSWNGGQAVGVEEQGSERKQKETPEQREERLAKLRDQFPYELRADPPDVVRRWAERESQDGAKRRLTKEQRLEMLFGAPVGGGGGEGGGGGGGGKKRGRGESPASSDEAEPCESSDEEHRMEREGLDDWRVGRTLIGKMGYDGEGGLGFDRQGVTTAIVPKPRFGMAGLGSALAAPRPAGIPRKRPNLGGSPNLSPRLA